VVILEPKEEVEDGNDEFLETDPDTSLCCENPPNLVLIDLQSANLENLDEVYIDQQLNSSCLQKFEITEEIIYMFWGAFILFVGLLMFN